MTICMDPTYSSISRRWRRLRFYSLRGGLLKRSDVPFRAVRLVNAGISQLITYRSLSRQHENLLWNQIYPWRWIQAFFLGKTLPFLLVSALSASAEIQGGLSLFLKKAMIEPSWSFSTVFHYRNLAESKIRTWFYRNLELLAKSSRI